MGYFDRLCLLLVLESFKDEKYIEMTQFHQSQALNI